MKRLLVVTIIILLWASPAMAVQEEPGIHGSMSFKYDLAEYNPGQSWRIDLYYSFKKLCWLNIGISEVTNTDGYNTYFDSIPAFTPYSQLYEVYIKIKPTNSISLKLSQWCLHPVYSGNEINDDVKQGLYIEGEYRF
jgi:hypothetical protein